MSRAIWCRIQLVPYRALVEYVTKYLACDINIQQLLITQSLYITPWQWRMETQSLTIIP